MPQLIRTPEQYFREERKDLYFIEFADAKGSVKPFGGGIFGLMGRQPSKKKFDPDHPPGHAEILAWFAEHLPDTCLEPLGQPESSGIMSGGINGRLRVDFNEVSLQTWTARWETEDHGAIDPRFACFQMTYEGWKEKVDAQSQSRSEEA